MNQRENIEIQLINRPNGLPLQSDFKFVQSKLREIKGGELVIKNVYMSVDPYMRGRMNDRESYTPPFQLNEPMDGSALGEVIESRNPNFKIGEFVRHGFGWRKFYISNGQGLLKVDATKAPLQANLSVLGMTGLTAYAGLLHGGQLKERISQKQGKYTVFVSGAAGAVGSIVGQIAKLYGCYVVGSAGSNAKVAWLVNDLGFDAAINYKKVSNLTDEVQKHFPNGIDLYFDNVGGNHLDAALANMNIHGFILICGMISEYNTETRFTVRNLPSIIGKRLEIHGFLVSDHVQHITQFAQDMGKWIKEGKIKWKETIIDGLENAPNAFIGLFHGENIGKMLVKIE